MNFHKICDTVEPILDKYKNEDYIEMEFRLGKFNGTFFDTNIGEKMYITILNGLNKYTGWDRIVQSETEVFYREKDNLRITIDESTNEETIIKKERVHVEDFKQLEGTPFDIRFSVCKEIPMEHDYESEMDGKKTKTRTSYIRKNVSIDVTSISGNTQDMDSEDPFTYQVEFEIMKPQNVEDKDTLFNIIHKIKDLFNIL
ncbi:hypothetical protein [Bathycoccus sp. RCC716 virus 1]|uniref:mRNA 5'-phosphatase n=1 Tax=Bathycoccus sp. RCC716 virus 1 TaxID=2530038 RepID=A0A7S6NXX8_9PHYC|nr:hypothetical protein [Bathycoccus sp. RCC716 virus 1]